MNRTVITARTLTLLLGFSILFSSCMTPQQKEQMAYLEAATRNLRELVDIKTKENEDLNKQLSKYRMEEAERVASSYYTKYAYCKLVYTVSYTSADENMKVPYWTVCSNIQEVRPWSEDEKYRLLDNFESKFKSEHSNCKVTRREVVSFDSYAAASKSLEKLKQDGM